MNDCVRTTILPENARYGHFYCCHTALGAGMESGDRGINRSTVFWCEDLCRESPCRNDTEYPLSAGSRKTASLPTRRGAGPGRFPGRTNSLGPVVMISSHPPDKIPHAVMLPLPGAGDKYRKNQQTSSNRKPSVTQNHRNCLRTIFVPDSQG